MDFVFNIAKGRVAELYNRVESGDPAAAALVVVLLEATGLEADAVLKDLDTLAAVLSGTTNEQTTMGRKVLTAVELAAWAPDDQNDRMDIDIPDLTWTDAAGDPTGKLLVCYDADTGGGTDADIVPLTGHDFTVTPDGSDITAQIYATGFYRAA